MTTVAQLEVIFSTQGDAAVAGALGTLGAQVESVGAKSSAMAAGAGVAFAEFGRKALDAGISAVQMGASVDQTMHFINALAGGGASTLQLLQNEALKLDQTTVFSFADIAAGMQQLASEGFTPLQIAGTNATNSLIQQTADMAAALRINTADAANFLGMTSRSYAAMGMQADQIANILTEASLRSGKSADEFATQMGYVTAVGAQMKIPLNDLSAAVSELMSQNIPNAGSGLRAFLVGITAAGSPANKELTALGISAYDAQGKFIGLGPLIDKVNAALKGLSPAAQSAAIKELSGGNRQVSALIQLLADGTKGLTDTEGKMGTLGSAAKVMGDLVNTAAGKFHILTSSLETAKILMGETALGIFGPVAGALAKLVQAFNMAPGPVHALALAITGLSGAFGMMLGGKLLLGAFGTDLGSLFQVAREGAAGLTESIMGAGATLLDFLPEIALVAGAGLLLYQGWQENWFGIADATRKAVGDVGAALSDAKTDFQQARHAGLDVFVAGLSAVTAGAASAFGASSWITHGAETVQLLGEYFDATFRQGNTFNGMLKLLPKSLQGVAQALGIIVDSAHDFVKAWGDDGMRGVIRQVPAEMFDVSVAFARLIGQIPGLSGVGTALETGIRDVEAVFNDFVSVVDRLKLNFLALVDAGFNPIQAALAVLSVAFPKFTTAFQDLGKAVQQDVSVFYDLIGALTAFVTADYGKAFSDLKQAAVDAFTGMGDAAAGLGSAIRTGIGDIDWGGIGDAVRSGLQDAADLAVAAGINLGQIAVSIGDWLISAVVPLAVKVGLWLLGQEGTVGHAALQLGTYAVEIAGWAIHAVISLADQVRLFALGERASVGTALLTIASYGVEILGWAVTAAISLADQVSRWALGERASVGDALLTIASYGVEILGWTVSAAISLAEQVSRWALGERATVGSLLLTIGSYAVQILGWAVSSVIALADQVRLFALGERANVGQLLLTIGSYAVQILAWAVSAVVSLADQVTRWALGERAAVGQLLLTIGSYAVQILAWTVTEAESLGSAIASKVDEWWLALTGGPPQPEGAYPIDIGGWKFTATDSLATKLEDQVKTWIGNVNWSGLASNIDTGLATTINSVNWQSAGQVAGQALGAALEVAAALAWVGFKALWNSKAMEAATEAAINFMAGFIEGLGSKAADALTAIQNQVNSWGLEVHTKLAAAFMDAGTWLLGVGENIVQGIITGADLAWGMLSAWFTSLEGKTLALLANAVGWLHGVGENIIQGLITGASTAWGALSAWFQSLPNKITSGLADAATWLLDIGKDIITGLVSGIEQATGSSLGPKLSGLPGWIAGIVPSMAYTLVTQGADLIIGLVSGLSAATASSLGPKLSGLGAWAAHAVGNIASDFEDVGKEIVSGIVSGITSGAGDIATAIKNAITGQGPDLSKTRGASAASGAEKGPVTPSTGGGAVLPGGIIVTQLPDVGTGSSLPGGPGAPGGIDLSAIVQAFAAAGQQAAAALGAGLQTALTSVTATRDAIVTIATNLGPMLAAAATGAGQAFAVGLGAGLQAALTATVAVTVAINGIVLGWAAAVGALALAAGSGFAINLGAGLQSGLSASVAVAAAIRGQVSSLAASLGAEGSAGGSEWAYGLGAGLQTGLGATSAVAGAISGILYGLAGSASGAGSDAGYGFAYGLGGGLNTALGAAAGTAGGIASILSIDLSGEGANAGYSFAAGLASAEGAAYGAAAAIAAAAVAGASTVLGIHSPSTVMRKKGVQTGEGFELGVRDTIPAVAAAMRDLLQPAASPSVNTRSLGAQMRAAAQTGDTYNIAVLDAQQFQDLLTAKDIAFTIVDAGELRAVGKGGR